MIDIYNIPFKDFGVDDVRGKMIIQEILNQQARNPYNSISIQQIADATESTGYEVKKVFLFLLYRDYLTATYTPYHKRCGSPIGNMEDSVNEIRIEDYMDSLCSHCPDPISVPEDIEIRLTFWGADK